MSEPETPKDKYGRELVYAKTPMLVDGVVHWVERKNGTIPNRMERRRHGIRRPLRLINQHRDLLESLASIADEGSEEIRAEDGAE